jgi:uncharacterized RDD family membrane protein YckC
LNAIVLDLVIIGVATRLLLIAVTVTPADAGLLFLLVQFAYFFAFELHDGRTPGKRAFHVRVTTPGGSSPTHRQAAIRNAMRIFDALPLLYASGLLSLMRTGRARRQRLGDVAAGTIVVLDPDAKPLRTPRWLLPAATITATLVSIAVVVAAIQRGPRHTARGREGQIAQAQSAESWCVPRSLPAVEQIDLQGLRALRRSLLGVVYRVGTPRYAWGTIGPENMWSDNSPQRLVASGSARGLFSAGYETRQWAANRDDIATDVLQFASPRTARQFFLQAASVNCHRHGVQTLVRSPARALNLTWLNPDGFWQHDVFLLRGQRVYRVVDVRGEATHSRRLEEQAGRAIVNALVCGLPQAGCGREANSAV